MEFREIEGVVLLFGPSETARLEEATKDPAKVSSFEGCDVPESLRPSSGDANPQSKSTFPFVLHLTSGAVGFPA